MSSNQNITSSHRSRNRERNGYVLIVTSLKKEKLAPFFRLGFPFHTKNDKKHPVSFRLSQLPDFCRW